MERIFELKKLEDPTAMSHPSCRDSYDRFVIRVYTLIAIGFIVLIALFSEVCAQENGTDLTFYTRANNQTEKYYAAGDAYLEKAFDKLQTWWNYVSTSGLHLTRGYVDQYLPLALREMQQNAADAMMQRFAEYLWSQRSPTTDLVPTSFGFLDPISGVQVQNHQGVHFPAKLPEFLRWFPKNDTYQQ
jgi:hypothetical protein